MKFENMHRDNIEIWISSARRSNLNRGGLSVSLKKEKSIKDLLLWVKDSLLPGRVNVEADFYDTDITTTNMTDMDYEAYIHYLDCKTNSDVITPDKFSYTKWYIWEELASNWLHTKIGVTNIPISYIIHKYNGPLTVDCSKLIIYKYRLTNTIFRAEIRKVANL